MWQSVVVVLIVCAALAFVIQRMWRTAKNESQGGCGCAGCGTCSGSASGGQKELQSFQTGEAKQSESSTD